MKKNNFLAAFLILSVFVLLSAACKPRVIRRTRSVKDTSLARVLVKRKLVVGIRNYFPPYVMSETIGHQLIVSEGNKVSAAKDGDIVITGFDIELARAVGKALNIEVEFKVLRWDEMVDALQKNKIDCVWNAASSDDFENLPCIFSDAYIASVLSIVVPQGSPYNKVSELYTKMIGLYSLTDDNTSTPISRTVAKAFPSLRVYVDIDTAMDAVKKGRVDGLVMDGFAISDQIKNGENVRMINEPIYRMYYSVAFREQDTSLRDRINETLINLEYDGTLAKISRKWLGTDVIIVGK